MGFQSIKNDYTGDLQVPLLLACSFPSAVIIFIDI